METQSQDAITLWLPRRTLTALDLLSRIRQQNRSATLRQLLATHLDMVVVQAVMDRQHHSAVGTPLRGTLQGLYGLQFPRSRSR